MTYTNNVPQGNQQISTTQPLIQANFAYLQNSIGQEHNFDATDATKTYHKLASMPNQALSPALPSGTNGVYFVNSGLAYFYDGTTNFQLSQFQTVLTGNYTSNSTSTFSDIIAVPANVQGIIILTSQTIPAGQMGTFMTDATNCYGFSTRMKINGSSDDYPIELNNSNNALMLQGRRFSSSYSGPYTFKVFYRPV